MKSQYRPVRSLRAIEQQVDREAREFKHRRLKEELEKEAQEHGVVFPPKPTAPLASAPTSDDPIH